MVGTHGHGHTVTRKKRNNNACISIPAWMRACWPYTDPCGYMIVGLSSYGILIPMHGCNGLRWHGSKLVKGWLKNLEECLWRCILLDEIRIDGECPQDFKFRWHTWWSRTISILKFIEGPLERMQGELHYSQQITMKIVILRIMIEQEGEDIILFWMRFYG